MLTKENVKPITSMLKVETEKDEEDWIIMISPNDICFYKHEHLPGLDEIISNNVTESKILKWRTIPLEGNSVCICSLTLVQQRMSSISHL